jgi:hypothetical protein
MSHEGTPQPPNPDVLAQTEQIINTAAAREVPQVTGEVGHPLLQATEAVSSPDAAYGVMQDAGARLPEVAKLVSERSSDHLAGSAETRDAHMHDIKSRIGSAGMKGAFTNRPLAGRMSQWAQRREGDLRDASPHGGEDNAQ